MTTSPRGEPRRMAVVTLRRPPIKPMPPPRYKSPSFFGSDARGRLTINRYHWSAPIFVVLHVIFLPLLIFGSLFRKIVMRVERFVAWCRNRQKDRS